MQEANDFLIAFKMARKDPEKDTKIAVVIRRELLHTPTLAFISKGLCRGNS